MLQLCHNVRVNQARLGVKKLLELIDRYFHDIPEPLGAARARVAIAPPEGAGGYGVAILPLYVLRMECLEVHHNTPN